MDPVQKMWMFENWIADQNDDVELAKNHAYLLGSFWNPEAVREIVGSDNKHISSDKDFEESLEIVKNYKKPGENNKRHRRRLKIK